MASAPVTRNPATLSVVPFRAGASAVLAAAVTSPAARFAVASSHAALRSRRFCGPSTGSMSMSSGASFAIDSALRTVRSRLSGERSLVVTAECFFPMYDITTSVVSSTTPAVESWFAANRTLRVRDDRTTTCTASAFESLMTLSITRCASTREMTVSSAKSERGPRGSKIMLMPCALCLSH